MPGIMDDDIAIIGVGLRFPGNATSPEELWKVLERRESQWSEFPKDRLNIDGYFHPSGDRQGSIMFRGAHFLKDNVAAFDAPFFAIAAEDAKAIDPQQRFLLEIAYEAMENAGIRKEDVDDSDTAVYVGSFVKDYEQVCLRDSDWQPQYAATGNGTAILSNRISYSFNFHGPSATVDTGCSASLVSVHMAIQSLRTGEASMALAGGGGMILSPNTIMPMTALNFLSPDGRSFTFDARANGYGRGEGVGMVVLKRLRDAVRDNDTIRAVIRGSRLNQDGRTTGITLPSMEAQVYNIRALYKESGLSYDQTGYVECHGTGTQAGDWRELKAISQTISSGRDVDRPVLVGSIKPNLGHLEGAAGIAGLIKSVLVLEHGKIPPNANFETPNPDIDFEDWKVKVPTGVMDWPIPGTRRVSVNCFGFGGTNAHVIVDEAAAYLKSNGLIANHSSKDTITSTSSGAINGGAGTSSLQLFCFSSSEKSGLMRVMERQISYVQDSKHDMPPGFLTNYAYTLGCRRSNLEWKTSFVASTVDDLLSKMATVDKDSFVRSYLDRATRVCFIFSGQGAQWAQMGQELMCFDVFRKSLQSSSDYMESKLDSQFILLDEIFKSDDESRISDPEISQPATTALQIALVDLLESFGVQPSHVVGHSSGEIAAAFAAGALTREDAWKVSYYRGTCAADIPTKAPGLEGGMMAVEMSEIEAREYISSSGYEAHVACINSPRSVTLSGSSDAIGKMARDLKGRNVFHRALPVKVAYHSDHMKVVQEDYRQHLQHIEPQSTGSVMMISSVTGNIISGGELDADYWTANMVSPVQYLAALKSLMDLPKTEVPDVILEASPRSALRAPTADIIAQGKIKPSTKYISVLGRKAGGVEDLLHAVGELWIRGCRLEMENAIMRSSGASPRPKCLVDLPPYPWNHKNTYWHESHLGRANRLRQYPRQDLIGLPTPDSTPFEPRWRGFLRISENPWMQDHQVQKTIVYPAAGMATMVVEGARQMASEQQDILGYEIVNMSIEKAMIIPSTAYGLETGLNIKRDVKHLQDSRFTGTHEFSMYSKQIDGPWERHASGFLRFRYKDGGDWDSASHVLNEKYQKLTQTCVSPVNPRQLYELLDTMGMNYGSLFQNLKQLHRGGDSIIAEIRVPDTKAKMPAKFEYPHLIHPATLDTMFHTLFAIDPVPMVPIFIESLFVPDDLINGKSNTFEGYSSAHRHGIGGAKASIAMRPNGSNSYVTISGLQLTRLSGPTPENGGFIPSDHNLCTQIVWKEDVSFGTQDPISGHLELLAHKYPALRVLQVGGRPTTTLKTLEQLTTDGTPRLSRYTVVDATEEQSLAIVRLLEGSTLEPYVEIKKLQDLSTNAEYHYAINPAMSGMDPESLKKFMRPGGWIVNDGIETDLIFHKNGDSHKWHIGKDTTHIQDSVAFGDALDIVVLHVKNDKVVADGLAQLLLMAAKDIRVNARFSTMLFDGKSFDSMAIGGKVVISILDFASYPDEGGFVYDWTPEDFESFRAMEVMAKGIIWVTRGANMEPSNPQAAPIIGLSRTLRSEDSTKVFVTVDLSMDTSLYAEKIPPIIMAVTRKTFLENDGSTPTETEFAERDGRLYIPRLQLVNDLNRLLDSKSSPIITTTPFISDCLSSEGKVLELHITNPRLAGDSIYFTEFSMPEPGENEIQIEFKNAALTFQDLEAAQGRTSEPRIGMDVTGDVIKLGNNVSDRNSNIKPGRRVVALAPEGTMQNLLNVDVRFLAEARPGLVPSFYLSAYYALIHVGRIRPGRRVLVHAGATGFGAAAIKVCKIMGVNVLATIVGSGPKAGQQRDALIKIGLSKEQLVESNASDLSDAVKLATGGRGVDVMYDPTQGSYSPSADCVRPGGTIVQLQDRSSTGTTRAVPSSGTFVSFDLSQMIQDDVDFVAELFEETMELLRNHSLDDAIPKTVIAAFDIEHVRLALKHLENTPFIGNTVVSSDRSSVVPISTVETSKPLARAINPTGTYLLAGGLGGLGRSITEMLVASGARHFAFLSRSGASSEEARLFIRRLEGDGIDAQVYRVDVCDEEALMEVVGTRIVGKMPPIHGVFQCAAVIKDAVFDNMIYEDWITAFRPKTRGSLNLVKAIESSGQEPFFIFLASSTGVIGNRGQANYASGNSLQDALARCLRLEGKHAVAIDLGPVLGSGMLADDEATLDILRASGFYGIRHEDFLKVVKHAITLETFAGVPMPPQVTLAVGTGGILAQINPPDPYWAGTALYSHLNMIDMPPPDLSQAGGAGGTGDMKTMLASSTDETEATNIITMALMHMLAKSMNMLFEEMDAGKPPNTYGVDSLVAVSVRNWVYSNCGVQVSVFEVLSDMTVAELSSMIAKRGGYGAKSEDV